jgi:hypothetical protein
MRDQRANKARAVDVSVDSGTLHVVLADGRRLNAPLECFPRLKKASEEQRANWRLIGSGVGIHWDEIDEDIAVGTLLDGADGRRP